MPVYMNGGEADTLLNKSGLALLIGMLLDQQVPMEWAFRGPLTLRERLGGTLDAKAIAAMDPEEVVAIFCAKPAMHRYPAAMGRRVHGLCEVIATKYKGKAENIWKGVDDANVLFARLRELPGYGEEKAQIFVAMLAKRKGVAPAGWQDAAGVFGDDVLRTAADIDSPAALVEVRKHKKAEKAALRDKQGQPLKTR